MAKLTISAALSNALTVRKDATNLQTVADRGNWWWPIVREPSTGAWQRNVELRTETVLTYHAVYACITLRASDIAKCRLRLVEQDSSGIWDEVSVAAFSPVLRRPNRYQNRIQFIQHWVTSKDIHGNTYVLKGRDNRGVVNALYILDPLRTKPLVALNGDVYYQLSKDNLSGVDQDSVVVPAREIIHDMTTLRHHPLCGIPPMAPAALAAAHGLSIQRNSAKFFQNGSNPGGILTAPGVIGDETAKRLKERWEQNYTGDNVGEVAVLGDGLKFEPMSMKAIDAQLIEQLGISGKMVCSSFNVPAYMVGVSDPPPYNNIQALNQQYYSQCLQKDFEAIELLLDEGLGLPEVSGHTYGTEFDLDDLLRMDTATLIEAEAKAVGAGIKKPDESRKRLNLGRVPGGDTPYLQEQNFSLAALAKRDAREDPWASRAPSSAAPKRSGSAASDGGDEVSDDLAAAAQLAAWELKSQLDLLAA